MKVLTYIASGCFTQLLNSKKVYEDLQANFHIKMKAKESFEDTFNENRSLKYYL